MGIKNPHYKVIWDEITYPFPNFNGFSIEIWKWISDFTPHFTGHVITYPCWNQSLSMLIEVTPWVTSLREWYPSTRKRNSGVNEKITHEVNQIYKKKKKKKKKNNNRKQTRIIIRKKVPRNDTICKHAFLFIFLFIIIFLKTIQHKKVNNGILYCSPEGYFTENALLLQPVHLIFLNNGLPML